MVAGIDFQRYNKYVLVRQSYWKEGVIYACVTGIL